MSKTHLSILLCMCIAYAVNGQISTYNPFFFSNDSNVTKTTPYELLALGKMHYDPTWNAGNIYLTNGDSLIAYYLRYDIIKNSLEVIINRKFYTIHNSQISSFEWFSGNRLSIEKFIRRDVFEFENAENYIGFAEVLEDGEVRLLKIKEIIYREHASSTLVPENAEGSDILILEKYFLVKDNHIHELATGKKRNLEFLNSEELETHVKEARLSFSVEGDLKSIVRYYNSHCID
ncbi:hypothetical protein [Fulvivirga sedimenti]|uniref:Uncharacterized protein n=1 Tax=Fulvivirga sedimenti TaxID=2879465 RepID=A0A9X1HKF0_9BACT|nr:hypothetical protein [Fulvivirga sedimenti]MCA6073461.1 hypothetical protein [Fulvivirga sedimenti]